MSTESEKTKVARLAYLLSRYKIQIPKRLIPHIPGGEWLQKLSQAGAGSTGVGMDQLQKLIRVGEQLGVGNAQEAVDLIQAIVDDALTESNISLSERISLYALLSRLSPMTMIANYELELDKPPDNSQIVKFSSGFVPADLVSDRFPIQSLVMIMGAPGMGKTTIMIALMEALRKSGACNSVLFVENEMPGPLMTARFGLVFERTQFRSVDKLICGPWSASDVLEYVTENPDPDRVIFFDSPDVVQGGGEEGRRFYLEAEYQTLVQLKQRSKMVVVSSQPRRKDQRMTLRSTAESWQKAWYVDLMLGLNRDPKGVNLVCLKNRFGPADMAITFAFDYVQLTAGEIEDESEYW